jgi:hypothetical protein
LYKTAPTKNQTIIRRWEVIKIQDLLIKFDMNYI